MGRILWTRILFVTYYVACDTFLADFMALDTICSRLHGVRYYLGQIVWPMILFVTDFVDCDTICGRLFGLGCYLWQIAWPRILFVADLRALFVVTLFWLQSIFNKPYSTYVQCTPLLNSTCVPPRSDYMICT